MSFVEILLIAVALAMDAFAVALTAGATHHGHGLRPALRLSFHFGLFQFLMPVAGWFLGIRLVSFLHSFDHWVAFGLLVFVGAHMLYEAAQRPADEQPTDPTRGLRMVTLSFATSIDALAVGLSLAMIRLEIWYPSAIIGVVTGVLSLVGIGIGRRFRHRFGRVIEVIGGLVLIGIGSRILWNGLHGR